MGGHPGLQLTGVFVGAICRQRDPFPRFDNRQARAVAINRCRRCINHRNSPALPGQCLENCNGPGQVDPVGAGPILQRPLDRCDGGQVKAAIDAGQRRRHGCRIGDRAFDQRCTRRKIGPNPGGKIIQDPDGMALADQRGTQVRADEPAPPGDEKMLHFQPVPCENEGWPDAPEHRAAQIIVLVHRRETRCGRRGGVCHRLRPPVMQIQSLVVEQLLILRLILLMKH